MNKYPGHRFRLGLLTKPRLWLSPRMAVLLAIAAVALVIIGLLFIGGTYVLNALGFIVLIVLIVLIRQEYKLVSCAILALLLKLFGGSMKSIAVVWFAGPRLDAFFSAVEGMNWFFLVFALFLPIYAATFILAIIRESFLGRRNVIGDSDD